MAFEDITFQADADSTGQFSIGHSALAQSEFPQAASYEVAEIIPNYIPGVTPRPGPGTARPTGWHDDNSGHGFGYDTERNGGKGGWIPRM